MKKGFTLIELLIVMVIIGILVSIAYPSYLQYIVSARRSDGQSAIMDLASRMERYYSERNTYLNATIGTGGANDIRSSNISPEGWYTLSISSQTASTYTLQAIPRNNQGRDDRLCQTLTVNSLGAKGIAAGPGGAPSGTVDQCW
ncbi:MULTISPECIES: type IV pilin protein [Legionella]|uniref:type IV pilin protein n=1 Tax=Legionella TaxID=445 RepID=UPI001054649B|nr:MULTISPECIES: type IV pilin protein [Legionella]